MSTTLSGTSATDCEPRKPSPRQSRARRDPHNAVAAFGAFVTFANRRNGRRIRESHPSQLLRVLLPPYEGPAPGDADQPGDRRDRRHSGISIARSLCRGARTTRYRQRLSQAGRRARRCPRSVAAGARAIWFQYGVVNDGSDSYRRRSGARRRGRPLHQSRVGALRPWALFERVRQRARQFAPLRSDRALVIACESTELDDRILAAITAWRAGGSLDDATFDALAHDLYEHQIATNVPYRRFAAGLGFDGRRLRTTGAKSPPSRPRRSRMRY